MTMGPAPKIMMDLMSVLFWTLLVPPTERKEGVDPFVSSEEARTIPIPRAPEREGLARGARRRAPSSSLEILPKAVRHFLPIRTRSDGLRSAQSERERIASRSNVGGGCAALSFDPPLLLSGSQPSLFHVFFFHPTNPTPTRSEGEEDWDPIPSPWSNQEHVFTCFPRGCEHMPVPILILTPSKTVPMLRMFGERRCWIRSYQRTTGILPKPLSRSKPFLFTHPNGKGPRGVGERMHRHLPERGDPFLPFEPGSVPFDVDSSYLRSSSTIDRDGSKRGHRATFEDGALTWGSCCSMPDSSVAFPSFVPKGERHLGFDRLEEIRMFGSRFRTMVSIVETGGGCSPITIPPGKKMDPNLDHEDSRIDPSASWHASPRRTRRRREDTA